MKSYLLLFLLTGCGLSSAPLHSNFVIDSNFTADEQDSIITGIHEWETATDGLIKVEAVISDNPEFYGNDTNKILKSDESLIGGTGGDLYGLTERIASTTKITFYTKVAKADNQDLLPVVEHEFGHVYGLVHVSQGLMRADVTGEKCIDDVTLSQFCDIHDCSGKNIKSNCK